MISPYRVKMILGAAVLGAMSALPARAAEGPLQFYTITPCRVVDTRLTGDVQGRYGPSLTSDTVRKFPIRGNCGIPADARAVSLNVTGVGPVIWGTSCCSLLVLRRPGRQT